MSNDINFNIEKYLKNSPPLTDREYKEIMKNNNEFEDKDLEYVFEELENITYNNDYVRDKITYCKNQYSVLRESLNNKISIYEVLKEISYMKSEMKSRYFPYIVHEDQSLVYELINNLGIMRNCQKNLLEKFKNKENNHVAL